jgi:hypothetical protein
VSNTPSSNVAVLLARRFGRVEDAMCFPITVFVVVSVRNRVAVRRDLSAARVDRFEAAKFDGKSSIDTFLIQFAICADYNEWDDEELYAILMHSLTGDVDQILFWRAQIRLH